MPPVANRNERGWHYSVIESAADAVHGCHRSWLACVRMGPATRDVGLSLAGQAW